jgi:hypothetical protein
VSVSRPSDELHPWQIREQDLDLEPGSPRRSVKQIGIAHI